MVVRLNRGVGPEARRGGVAFREAVFGGVGADLGEGGADVDALAQPVAHRLQDLRDTLHYAGDLFLGLEVDEFL